MINLSKENQPMSDTDLAVLNEIVKQKKAELDPLASDSEFWEFFSAQQILRDYQLDPEEVKFGIVGQESNSSAQGTDGGVDSIYLIVNGKLIRDVDQAKALSQHKAPIFDIIIIQSKRGNAFSITTLNRLANTSESIFKIDLLPENFAEKYNEPFSDAIECFREAHKALLTRHPTTNVYYYIVCGGDSGTIDKNVEGKARELETKIPKLLPTISTCQVHFRGARDTIALFNKPRKGTFTIRCASSNTDGAGCWMALVKLDEYFKLIAEDGQIREYLFESNVRDYEGDVEVNKQIRSTLETPQTGIDFWWLNNGITIVAENVSGYSGELVLDDPQIVNGLQTSQVIFDCLREPTLFGKPTLGHILVRIIKSNDDKLRDRIIRATNSQTKIPVQYLRASDDKQRDIELFFKSSGLHYDRRKNSWRKAGLKLENVVGVTELVQSVAAIIRQEPDHARARPSRYFINENYDKIFNENIPMEAYVVCALLRKRGEKFLRRVESDSKDRNNLLFYILTAIKPVILGKKLKLQEVDMSKVTDDNFKTAHSIVAPIYAKHGSNDKAAKGAEMIAELKAELKNRFGRKKKPAH
jgi:hypothetical protein